MKIVEIELGFSLHFPANRSRRKTREVSISQEEMKRFACEAFIARRAFLSAQKFMF